MWAKQKKAARAAALFLVYLQVHCVCAQLNRAPEFLQGGDMERFSLREDTSAGAQVYTLRGLDPEGTSLDYSISGDELSVNRTSGVVTLVRPLDRETSDVLEFIITITDQRVYNTEPNTVPLRRRVPILDVNDNAPKFRGAPYKVRIRESASPGATLFSKMYVSDADIGANADVTLECIVEESPEACDQFEVRGARLEEGDYVGIVSLRRPLDYEKRRQYTMAVRARDNGEERQLSSTAYLELEVEDVQDQPPVFELAPFSATVREASPQGTEVLEISARDGDLGDPRPLQLSLEDDTYGYFALENTRATEDGGVTTTLVTSGVSLDREDPLILNNGGIYSFKVRAEEEGTGETAVAEVVIVVTDVDDQVPKFNEESFDVEVSEDIADGTPLPGLNMVVTDGDVGNNAKFNLSLEDIFGSTGVFSIFPETAVGRTPVILKVKDSTRLDYEDPERSNFVFKVVASQQGQPVSSAVVNVTVADANDNPPTFMEESYRYRVKEDIRSGEIVATLTANDSDSGVFGTVRYSLKGFGAEKFLVDEMSGEISVASCRREICLDYETQKTYSLTYSAMDGGGKVTSVNIFIEVEDVNDNAPVFTQREYRRTVDQGATIFDPPLIVKARDKDGPSQGGGLVTYSLEGGNTEDGAFEVDKNSGRLTIRRPLSHMDTDTGTYTLTIRATDAGTPPLFSDINVYINVGHHLNRPPRFRQLVYETEVAENAPPGTSVIAVLATDPDGSDTAVKYSLTDGAKDNFVINGSTGVISVASEANLDRDANPDYKLMIVGVDSGAPVPGTSSTEVLINVTDVNNKPPVFKQESYVRYISERLPLGEMVLEVHAEDPDMNADLQYVITQPIKARDKTGVTLGPLSPYNYTSAFSINSTTGQVTVAGGLDHDSAAVLVLTVKATDLNAHEAFPDQTATAEVTVYVQAFSDKNPIFAPPWTPQHQTIEVHVEEEQPPGTVVFSVAAQDPVSGQPVRRYEKVSGSDPEGFFSVNAISGQVALASRLDYEASTTKTASLQVLAVAGDRSSEASVIVHIVDVNDNNPQFTENEYHARLLEDARFPKRVVTVTATDEDTGPFGEVRYSLGGDGALLFVVNDTTGEVQVARGAQLDREAHPILRLELTASDMPEGGANQRKTTVLVEVELTDVNDVAPIWSEPHYTAVVAENAEMGVEVAHILATDPDLGVNGVVFYQLPAPQGETDGLFALDPESGILSVAAPLSGKGRRDSYEVRVRALDQGTPQLYSETTLNVFIGDVSSNDGVPAFVQPGPNEIATVPENTKKGTVVYQVQAHDPDDPRSPNGKVVYSFLDDGASTHNIFEIDANTGLITTRGTLDREAQSTYTLVVVAQDMGTPPQLASRVLTINVTDVDDHTPAFVRLPGDEAIEMEVEEEAAQNTVVGSVRAQDLDEGPNAEIDYAITDGNHGGLFGINRTADSRGVIFVHSRVDREEVSEVVLTVLCGKLGTRFPTRKPYDAGDPSMVQVRVLISDLNDNKPQFVQPRSSAGVRVDAPLQTEVVRLQAHDADATALPLRYTLHNVSFQHIENTATFLPEGDEVNATGVFLLEENTGVLRTNAPLTRFAQGTFTVTILARSSPAEQPAVATVTIYVLRDSDLLRFVFSKTPGEVRRDLPDFTHDLQDALLVNAEVNIYDTDYYTNTNGAIDFSSTGSCFQLVGRNLAETRVLVDIKHNSKLAPIFDKYTVSKVENCVPHRSSRRTDWIELWVLVIAGFIGLGAFVAAIAVCCLYSRYRKKIQRHNHHVRLLESAGQAPQTVLPPGSILMLPPGPPGPPGSVTTSGPPGPPMLMPPPGHPSEHGRGGFEWQERGMPMDTMSYRSGQR
ncbi:cadherin-87A-like [Oratosquilla oratoria]|uniref:cadherin-87A-like n=1 Tax=Oratosquilla oratoria TaxID=337810 RepID=UPI003F773163